MRLVCCSLVPLALTACGDPADPLLPAPSQTGFVSVPATATGAVGLVPFDVNAQDLVGPDDHNAQYGKLPEIVVSPYVGGFDVALQSYGDPMAPRAFVLRYAGSAGTYSLAAAYEAPTLGLLLGFTRAADGGFYYATGTPDPDITPGYPNADQHRENVVHVYRADASGNVVFDVDLDTARAAFNAKAAPLVHPGVASSARLAVAGGQLAIVHGNNTEYDSNVKARHQMAMSTFFDAETGAITASSSIWVSHSFDQRYLVDGNDLYELHLGDAYPRAVVTSRVRDSAAGKAFELFRPKGNTGANNTFTRLGGIARIDSGTAAGKYFALFATEHGDVTTDRVNSARDLALVRSATDFASSDPAAELDPDFGVALDVTVAGQPVTNRVQWLTAYDGAADMQHAERPKLIPLGGGELLVLWEHWTGSPATFEGTWAMRVDGTGAILAAASRVSSSHLPRGDDAFVAGGNGCWLTGDASGTLTLHCVSPALAVTEAALP